MCGSGVRNLKLAALTGIALGITGITADLGMLWTIDCIVFVSYQAELFSAA